MRREVEEVEEEIVELLCNTTSGTFGDRFIDSGNLVAYCPGNEVDGPSLMVRELDQKSRKAQIRLFNRNLEVQLYRSGELAMPRRNPVRSLAALDRPRNLIFVSDISSFGTAGGRLGDAEGKEYILTAHHVLSSAGYGEDKEVLEYFNQDSIGTVRGLAPLRIGCESSLVNDHEAAVAELADSSGLDFSAHTGQPKPVKRGDVIIRPEASSLEHSGVVFDVGCYVKIKPLNAIFRGQIVIEDRSGPFCAGGDSGSLLVKENAEGSRDPVALLSWRSGPADGGPYSVATPIGTVIRGLSQGRTPLELLPEGA